MIKGKSRSFLDYSNKPSLLTGRDYTNVGEDRKQNEREEQSADCVARLEAVSLALQ